MRTYSHWLTTWLLARWLKGRVNGRAMLWGSVMPDAALVVLSMGYFLCFRSLALGDDAEFFSLYDQLYFTHPLWIGAHNLLHAPFCLAALYVGARVIARSMPRTLNGWRMHWWDSFLLGATVHSLADIMVHHHDGPLLLFPFDWQTRFESPISYWDPEHHGVAFSLLEHGLDTVVLGVIALSVLRRRASLQNV